MQAMQTDLQRQREYLALREAEIEERSRPEALTAEESNAAMREIFTQWGLDYAVMKNPVIKENRDFL